MKFLLWSLFIFLLFCLTVRCECNTININQGKIQGSHRFLGNYWSYLGIPYARFEGRFKEPGDPPSWNGTFKANRDSIFCKQYSPITSSIIGEEDCFTLNVFTPVSPSNTIAKPIPVIFFIHGGGYYFGSNNDTTYNASYLVKKGVVVVTINYRVGAFGFLCLKSREAAGNMGLKDQLAALKWVKNNIANFGGDPNSVTLYGESVGASSIDYFILTQTANGLFHRAIMDSGTSLVTQAFDRDPILTASRAASRLGYNTTDVDELLRIFLNSTADDVAAVSYKDVMNNALAAYIFKPCIEDPNTSDTTILTIAPQDLIKSAKYVSNISLIIGYNNKEGINWATYYDCKGLKMLDHDFSSAVPSSFTYRQPELKTYLIRDIRDFYFKNTSTNYCGLVDYFSDVLIMSPAVATIKAYSMNPNISMYNYYFAYDSLRNLVKLQSRLRWIQGASHGDELFYIFDDVNLTPAIPSDRVMIDRLTTLWTSFAKTGVPTANIGTAWPRNLRTLKFLKLDKKFKVIDLPNRERLNFWKRSYENYV